MNTVTKTPALPALDLNGNRYIARGAYRTADGKAQIDWTLADDKKGRGAIFSAQGHYNRGGGQNLDRIAKAYPNDATVQEIAAVWTAYHLNDMQPGTPAQMALGWGRGRNVALDSVNLTDAQRKALEARNLARVQKPRAEWIAERMKTLKDSNRERLREFQEMTGKAATVYDETNFQTAVCGGYVGSLSIVPALRKKLAAHLENQAANLFPVAPVTSEVFEDSLGAPCPETGKLYGHEWFFHAIPSEIVEQVKGWAARDNVAGESAYDAQARQFLTRNGLALRITLSDTKPANWTPSGHHYRVTIYRTTDEKARLVFDFWGSKADAEKGKAPSSYNVLTCISSDLNTPETLKDFCSEYGEDADSIKTRQTFNRASRFAKSLRAFFTSAERDELAEIN